MGNNDTVPICLSFILCDRIVADRFSQQHSIIGIITQINATAFPAIAPPLWFFAELTSGHGETPLHFEVVHSSEQSPPIFEADLVIDFKDPRAITHLAFRGPPLRFPDPGEYRVRVTCKGQFLAERRIILNPLAPPQQSGDTGRKEP